MNVYIDEVVAGLLLVRCDSTNDATTVCEMICDADPHIKMPDWLATVDRDKMTRIGVFRANQGRGGYIDGWGMPDYRKWFMAYSKDIQIPEEIEFEDFMRGTQEPMTIDVPSLMAVL